MSHFDKIPLELKARRRHLAGFRARVLGLCLLAVVPIIIVEVHNAEQSARQSIDEMRARAHQMVETADQEYDDLLIKGDVVLDFVQASPESMAPPVQCGVFTDSVKKRYSWITGIGVSAPNGDALCGEGARLHINNADKPYFQQALATKQETLSDFHIGQISHKPIITLLKPVLDENGAVLRVVGMGIDLKAFNEFLASKKIDPDVSVTFYDSTGTVLARYPDSEFAGRNMSAAPLVQTILAKKTGEYEGIGIANNSRQFAFKPFFGSSTYIAVGVLDQPVLARIHQRLIWSLLVILATIFTAAALSLIGVEILVLRPAKKLTYAAKDLGEGKFEALANLHASMPEMSELLNAFQTMAISLHSRETVLKESEATAQRINRNLMLGEQIADAGYWRIDYPTTHVTWSDGMFRVWGVSPKDFTPTLESALDRCHPDDRTFIAETVEMAVNLQRDFEYTARIVRPDGEIRHVLTRGFCDIGSNGTVQSIFGAIIDVTKQKEIEGRLKLARKAAETANRAKSDFLSSMSHELRTPLTSIIGFADLLLLRTRSKETRHYLSLQREAGQHLLSLINDILDHSKIEAGKLQLESIPFDLRHVLQSSINVMTHEAERKGVALGSTVGVAVPTMLLGDPNRLKQIFLNLIGNAIKFTPAGSVEINIEPTGTAGDVVALHFSVTDTGVGVAPEKENKLFDRFTQAEKSTTRQFGGSGLGLSITKELVEAMGGTIGFDSIPGHGSTFWFSLRLMTAPEASSETNNQLEKTSRAGRILLAEDSPINQLLFTELLQTLGHEVISVSDGAAAVAAVNNGDYFDLVLMDVQMPVMDGLTATRTIRQGNYGTIPIIGMTANAMQDDIARCLEAGMDAHIAKPVDISVLTAVIERAMSGRIAAAE